MLPVINDMVRIEFLGRRPAYRRSIKTVTRVECRGGSANDQRRFITLKHFLESIDHVAVFIEGRTLQRQIRR